MAVPESVDLAGCARPLSGRLWRAVESQTYALTRELVQNSAEQARLEAILEGSKPRYRAGSEHLDYLLKTPFRYAPPKRGGSRFRRPHAGYGAFYGAEHPRTALAELVFHRYRFLQASPGTDFPSGEETLTLFAADFHTPMALDLTEPPLNTQRSTWTAPSDYSDTQLLGERAVEGGIGAIRYESVRDPVRDDAGRSEGRNVALLDPGVFDPPHHQAPQTWFLYLGTHEANARRTHAGLGERFDFARTELVGEQTSG